MDEKLVEFEGRLAESIGWLGDAESVLSEVFLAVGRYPDTDLEIPPQLVQDIDSVYQVLCQCRVIRAQLIQLTAPMQSLIDAAKARIKEEEQRTP